MCDYCGRGESESRWKTPPATPERIAEVKEWQRQTILDVGHTITFVGPFAYSIGRSLFGYPELLVTGALPPEIAGYMINTVADLESAGMIDLRSLVGARPVELDGFDCELRFNRVHAVVAEMRGAVAISGPDVDAIQIVWPDPQGLWPEQVGFVYGQDAQPVYNHQEGL